MRAFPGRENQYFVKIDRIEECQDHVCSDLTSTGMRNPARVNKGSVTRRTLIFHGITFVALIIALLQLWEIYQKVMAARSLPMARNDIQDAARPSSTPLHECGSSPKEAESRGCIFDLMRNTWTPTACHNATAAQEALADNPWPLYLDKAGTKEVRLPELSFLPRVWSHYGFHKRHCAYVFKVAQQTFHPGQLVPSDLMSLAHLKHCGFELSNKEKNRSEERLGTEIVFGTASCVEYKDN